MFSTVIFIHGHHLMPSPLTRWWYHETVMKKSHSSVLSGAATVIKENWWKLVIPPWPQAKVRESELPLTNRHLFLSFCLPSFLIFFRFFTLHNTVFSVHTFLLEIVILYGTLLSSMLSLLCQNQLLNCSKSKDLVYNSVKLREKCI